MAAITVSRTTAGLPPQRRSKQAPAPRHLEAAVHYIDGRCAVEHVERNDAVGRREMDRWAGEALQRGTVDYVSVRPVDRVAGYERSR